ncbi:MAG: 3-phosphoglycerate dehydrogenase [Oscillospiraceae bacterium]|jgi:D-3-phosphoglycerate dehydrogenase|nr:3-phosphoglycerate dehydrogenase [Oscillospiraceae bacterium]
MYRIKTINNIAAAGTGLFSRGRYTVSPEEERPDAILVRSAKMHDMQFGGELLCIARAGAGTNNIPTDRCAERGIVVFNTPGANSEAVKELAICALIMSSRDVIGSIDWVRSIADRGDEVPSLVEAGKNAFTGPEIMGKKLGVIGLGAVGALIANAAVALGMEVYGHDPFLSIDAAWRLSSQIINAKDRPQIYKTCDYITLHVPYMESTHHMIDAEAIAQMKKGARVLNLSRAEVVDDDAMLAALESGHISRYVTDFPNAKTAGAKGVIAMPHLASSTPESEEKCAFMAAAQIIDYLENGNIINSVNMPYVAMPRMGAEPRVCVLHRNIPDMITKISGALSARGINIENMVNAAVRGRDLAYTLIDVSRVETGLREELEAVVGVTRVRILPQIS